MLDDKGILKTLKEYEKKIKGYGINKIGLFGSYAAGNGAADSDIDILVEFETGKKNFDNYMELKFLLEDLFNKEVDLVISDNIKSELKADILGSVEYVEELSGLH